MKISNLFKKRESGLLPALALLIIDVLGIGLGLIIFAYFHHVRPRELAPQTIILPTETPVTSTMSTSDPEPDTAFDPEEWGAKFVDKFIDGDPIKTENSYKSKNISIETTRYEKDDIVYFVQDIYVRYKSSFKTAFAKDIYGMGYIAMPDEIGAEHDAIAAVNGDYYGHSDQGVVIRNGVFYRETPFRDVGVLYNDGTMRTFSSTEFDAQTELMNGAYQAWGFGPMLLDANGQPMTEFDTDVPSKNPRSVLGYYEPGHYCFVLVDGRDPEYSVGMTIQELSQLMYDLGCKAAYNMDGGQTAIMCFDGKIVNRPVNGGRPSSDIIYIAEPEE